MEIYDKIENSFQIIENLFSDEGLIEFRKTRIADLYLYHFSLGTWIRNNLIYPKESHMLSLSQENGIMHPDDISSLIIFLFHYHISKKI